MKVKTPNSEMIVEPDPLSIRGKVLAAGKNKWCGIIQLSKKLQCSPNNIRSHVRLLIKDHGYGAKIDKGRFKIEGKPTLTWREQMDNRILNESDYHPLNKKESINDENLLTDPFK